MNYFLLILAKILENVATANVNTTCLGPSYQPVEPETLKNR